jgi:hypothetical protein
MINVILAFSLASSDATSWIERLAIIPHDIAKVRVTICRRIDCSVIKVGVVVARYLVGRLQHIAIRAGGDAVEIVARLAVVSSCVWSYCRSPVDTLDYRLIGGRIWAIYSWNDRRIPFEEDVDGNAPVSR